MKWTIYLFILINLGFGLWHYRSAEMVIDKTPIDDDNLRLVLLKEFLAQDPLNKMDNVQTAQSTVGRCNTLGPFKSKKKANRLRKELKKLGIPTERRMSKDNSRKGFWVLIPPAESRKDAKQSVQALKSKAIKDYFLVVTGEQTNAVSLGVFSQSDLAQKRYDQILALGFLVKIRQVNLPKREYWLDWPKDRQLMPNILDKFRLQFPNIGQTDRAC